MRTWSSTRRLSRELFLGIGVGAAALLLQWGLQPWTGPRVPILMTALAIGLTATNLGRLSGFMVLLIGLVNAMWVLSPPGQWWVHEKSEQVAFAAFAAIGAILVAVGGRLSVRNSRADRAEQRLSLAQDETGVGLFELDYRNETAHASPALCQILGQPVMRAPIPLQQWLDALGAGHVAESRQTMQCKLAAGELRYERELHVTLPDGQQRWLLSRIRLEVDKRGELEFARGATLDITARKQLLTELQAAQSQLRQQLDDLGRLHSLGNRLLATPTLNAALQATLDAVCLFHEARVGLLRLRDTSGGSRLVAHCGLGNDALIKFQSFEAALESDVVCGPAARSGCRVSTDIEREGVLSECSLARELGMRGLHSTPMLAGGDGQVLGVISIFTATASAPGERLVRLTDLCAGQAAALVEREQALLQARETQQRFEVALESSSVPFTILQPVRGEDGKIIDFAWSYANPAAAELIGRPVDELLGRPILDLLPHAWNEPGFFNRYVMVSEQGCTAEFDTLTQGPGPKRWLHVIASALNGSVALWFADITQRRKEQQALQDADRRKDEFLATLAHELRNPLAPIRHAADIVSNPLSSESQRVWSQTVIERQLRHMTLLLDDLLDVSRITRGTLRLRRERCELATVVESAIETSQPLFIQRRHQLTLNMPSEPLWLHVDPLRLGQVLGNLFVNAAKYTPQGGEVVLDARLERGEAVLTVTDNGIGLLPEDCDRVFEMFAQVPSSDAQLQGGLGIGLALARKLMQLHGGQLVAESGGPGCGSVFTARFPALSVDGRFILEHNQLSQEPSQASFAGTQHRILIADDNRDAADSLAVLLRLKGFEVKVAYDGVHALASCDSFMPQVAVLDIGMPGHSGMEVATIMRKRPRAGSLKLIAVTGYGQKQDSKNASNAGFDHYLPKPVSLDELLGLIRGPA